MLSGLDLEVLSAGEMGIIEEVEEDRNTFAGNAYKKASFVAGRLKEWAVSDDSGLCIDVLGGEPGVKSARWAGPGKDLVSFTLEKMKDISEGARQAYFESAAVLVSPQGEHWTFRGRIDGIISLSPQGQPRPGLPYDAIFIPQGFNKTFAEISEEEKNSLSHRGWAFKQLRDFLEKQVDF